MSILISVVLCTYNRASLLKSCIDSLIQQTLDGLLYEVIVVDNDSTDETAEIVLSYKSSNNIHYVFEEIPGLSYARNRGVKESKGEYIAFIDDDAKASHNWLQEAKTIINNSHELVDCLGGPILPWYIRKKPDWFLEKYEIRGFGEKELFLKARENLSGSNMIWYKQSLLDVGCFDINLGVVADQLRLGEETHAFRKLRFLKNDAKIFYSPNLIIYHLVPDHKMKVTYRLKRKFSQGQFTAYSNPKKGWKKIGIIYKYLFRSLIMSLRFIMKIFSHPRWQNWVFEDGGIVAYNLGILMKYLGFEPKNIQDR